MLQLTRWRRRFVGSALTSRTGVDLLMPRDPVGLSPNGRVHVAAGQRGREAGLQAY